eukprot:scaffold2646_cov60-Skeletonema_dohrnii-CCMP3373.AAC.1
MDVVIEAYSESSQIIRKGELCPEGAREAELRGRDKFGDLCRVGTAVVFVFKRENESKEAVEMERVAACTHCEGDGLLIKPCQHNLSRCCPAPGHSWGCISSRKNLAAT